MKNIQNSLAIALFVLMGLTITLSFTSSKSSTKSEIASTDYIIVTGMNQLTLTSEVNKKLSQGYSLVGGVDVITNTKSISYTSTIQEFNQDVVYFQAMAK